VGAGSAVDVLKGGCVDVDVGVADGAGVADKAGGVAVIGIMISLF